MFINSILLQAAGGGMDYKMLIMMGLVFVVFYFFMIRPQQKKQKDAVKWRSELKKGDKVVTIGGLFGTVWSVGENSIVIEPEPGVRLTFSLESISMEASQKAQKAS